MKDSCLGRVCLFEELIRLHVEPLISGKNLQRRWQKHYIAKVADAIPGLQVCKCINMYINWISWHCVQLLKGSCDWKTNCSLFECAVTAELVQETDEEETVNRIQDTVSNQTIRTGLLSLFPGAVRIQISVTPSRIE